MIEETLAAAIKSIRDHTALRAWAAEFLAVFAICVIGRFGLGVWLFYAMMASAGAGAGSGIASGVVPAPVGEAAAEFGAGLWWMAWLHAYDNLRSYAESAIIMGLLFTTIFEGGIMFLARKRIRLSKEEVRAEMQPQVDAANAAAAQANARLETLQAENQALRERQALRDDENPPLPDAAAQTGATAQAAALLEIARAENQALRERAALQDEQIRWLREILAQRENGNSTNGNGQG